MMLLGSLATTLGTYFAPREAMLAPMDILRPLFPSPAATVEAAAVSDCSKDCKEDAIAKEDFLETAPVILEG